MGANCWAKNDINRVYNGYRYFLIEQTDSSKPSDGESFHFLCFHPIMIKFGLGASIGLVFDCGYFLTDQTNQPKRTDLWIVGYPGFGSQIVSPSTP